MSRDLLLEVRDLKVRFHTYEGIVEAVDVERLWIHRGEVLGLVGETGCGKTITLLSVMRLVPEPGRIEGGEIYFLGEDLLKVSEERMREIRGSKIAMIFQDPMSSLNPVFTVGEQVGRVIMLHQGVGRDDARFRAEEIFELVGLPDARRVARSYPHELSGGMRQRVMIGMALSCRPELVIADEPSSALDVTTEANILRTMGELKDRYGTSILFVTHDLALVAEICDRVAIMYAGHVVEVGEVEAVYTEALHPYTQGLLDAMPTPEKRKKKLLAIPGTVPSPIDLSRGCSFQPRCPKAMKVCETERPRLVEVERGHFVSCFLYT